MLNLLTITLRNFLGYGNNTTVFNFNSSGTTLIVGENGSGKSTIIEALVYAGYDRTISSIKLDHLVNHVNKKHMEVTMTFERDGTYYHIVRCRKMKSGPSGNFVRFYKRANDANFEEKDELTMGGVDNTNRAIIDAIGLPFELFVRIVVFSALHVSFLELPPRHPTQPCQVAFIENLFSITTLSDLVISLKSKINSDETGLNLKLKLIDQLKHQHSMHDDQIAATMLKIERWEKQRVEDSVRDESELEKSKEIDFDAQKETLQTIKECKSTAVTLQNEMSLVQRDVSHKGVNLQTLKTELFHLTNDECPYCKRDYKDQMKLTLVTDQIMQLEEGVAELQQSITEKKEMIAELSATTAELSKQAMFRSAEELFAFQSKANSLQDKIQASLNLSNPYISVLDDLQKQELDPVDFTEANDLTKYITHEKFLSKLLSDKDSFIRKTILNKYIPFLNTRLQKYLQDLELPHSVYFTHAMEAEISQFGSPLGFGNLSHGQRARVNIALSLGFRDVLQKLHGKVNLCILDEVLDAGLDAQGVSLCGRALKRIARDEGNSIFIITHRNELDGVFDRVLKVQMDRGFSYIDMEDHIDASSLKPALANSA